MFFSICSIGLYIRIMKREWILQSYLGFRFRNIEVNKGESNGKNVDNEGKLGLYTDLRGHTEIRVLRQNR